MGVAQEVACFRALAAREATVLPRRVAEVAARLDTQRAREVELQERYKHLVGQRDELRAQVAAAVLA